MWFWGVVFMISTTLVGLFKHESDGLGKTLKSDKKSLLSSGKLDEKLIIDDDFSDTADLDLFSSTSNLIYELRLSKDKAVVDKEDCLENDDVQMIDGVGDKELSLWDTYKVMLGVLRLKPVLYYIGVTFLVKVND